jgi:hypothetical protein
VIHDAERNVPLPKERVDLFVEPRRMAELERGPEIRRDQLEHALEPRGIAP